MDLIAAIGSTIRARWARPARIDGDRNHPSNTTRSEGDELEEGEELLVAVPVVAGVGHPAGGHLQGGEQGGGAVTDVVVGGLGW